MDTQRLIINKIADRLSKSEEEFFAALLKSDKTFAEDYQSHLDLHMAIKASEKERIKQDLKKLEQKYKKKEGIKRWLILTAIAASIVLIFVIVDPFKTSSGDDIFAAYYQPYPNTYQPVVRGETNDLTLAFMAYENGNYAKSANLFSNSLAESANENIRFYYALSLLSKGDTEMALTEFNKLEPRNFLYHKELLWYKSLAALQIESSIEALNLLQQLKTRFPDYKTKEVTEILGQLEGYQ